MTAKTTEHTASLVLPAGFTDRPVTLDDLDAVLHLLHECTQEEIGERTETREDLRLAWETPGFSLEQSTRLVFAPDGTPAAYIEVWDLGNPLVRIHLFGRVRPAFRGRGLGTALLRWGEARAHQALARAPEGARVVIQTGTTHGFQPAEQLLADHGYRLVRHWLEMIIEFSEPAPEPQWPEGITVRTYRPDKDAERTYRAIEDAFRDHWGHVDEPFDHGFPKWQHWVEHNPDFAPDMTFLALDGEQIAGVCLCLRRFRGDEAVAYVDTLGVRRPWRKRGLGRALLQHAFRTMQARGKRAAVLHVDAASLTGATRLYESVGMRARRQWDTYEKELRPGVELTRR